MKFRIAIVSTLLVLGLVSCSLAEDITPPPDYVAPTVVPSNTPVPAATSTPVPPTKTEVLPSLTSDTTASTDPAITTETAPTEITLDVSPTLGVQTGIVNGVVINGSGGNIPEGLSITLRGFDMPTDPNGSPTEPVNQVLPLQENGRYEFANVEMPAGRIFLAQIEYNGVMYQSDYLVTEQTSLTLPDLTIYETTDDYTILSVNQVHVELNYSTADVVTVYVVYVLTNPTTKTVVVATDGTSIPFVEFPEGVTDPSFQVANGSAAFIGTADGFALAPSKEGEQYGLVAVFSVPYEKKITLAQPFILPAASVKFFAPEGVKLTSNSLTDQGLQDFGGTSYHLYEMTNIASDTTLTVKISGKPASAVTGTSEGITQNQWLIIGLGTLGMALIGIGLFFFIRERRRSLLEDREDEEGGEGEEGEGGENTESDQATDALGDDRDAILDAILALDDQFKAGEISKDVYETRRTELKERLMKLG